MPEREMNDDSDIDEVVDAMVRGGYTEDEIESYLKKHSHRMDATIVQDEDYIIFRGERVRNRSDY